MKKSDLKTGMRIETRRGDIFLVIKDIETLFCGHQDIGFAGNDCFTCGDNLNDDLTSITSKSFDIVKVFQINHEQKSLLNDDTLNLNEKHLIWKRKEFTEEQNTLFKALKSLGFKYIARDNEHRSLIAYDTKPLKGYVFWHTPVATNIYILEKDHFEFIKWEDKEPFEIPELQED